jgi:hypothetical protein
MKTKKKNYASFSEHINKHIEKNNKQNKPLECEFCGKVKEEFSFMIGAAVKADWCMHEGTGKISCPDCYDTAQTEATNVIDGTMARRNEEAKSYRQAKAEHEVNTMPRLEK